VGGYAVHVEGKAPPPGAPNINIAMTGSSGHDEHVVHETRPQDAPRVAVEMVDARAEMPAPRDAQRAIVTVVPPDAKEVAVSPDAAVEVAPIEITVLAQSSYRIDKKGDFTPIPTRVLRLTVDRPMDVEIKNQYAETARLALKPGEKNQVASQPFLPVAVTPTCTAPDASVTVNGDFAVLGQPKRLFFDPNSASSQKKVEVVFTGGKTGASEPHSLTLVAGETQEVKCALH
ncbi:MAG TPA: hypothetical protein VIV58_34300, partial [Kofleriaceae bacterium]